MQYRFRRRFLGSIRYGTLCAPIPLSRNSARKSDHQAIKFVTELQQRVAESIEFSVEPAASGYGHDEPIYMTGFFEELQRRKVYRVAAAYIIAAGFIIQIGSAVFPAWELPNWTLRLVVVLLLIGFPIALILSWAYDVTAQGIRATPTVSVPGTHRRRNLILLVATGVIVSAAAGFFLLPRASARKIDKSIAVLPFQNLSDEKENAYFADGMQDDILTNLSKIG